MGNFHYAPENLRNIAVVAAGGTGKSTLIEKMLIRSHAIGSDRSKGRAMFTEPEEQARQIAITPHVGHLIWNEREINVVDTPGYYNFMEQTRGVLPGVDGAVVIFSALEGARPECRRLWRMLREASVPCIGFLNFIDSSEADFVGSLRHVQETLRVKVVPLAIPLHDESGHSGVVDLLSQQAWRVQGDEMVSVAIPGEMRREVESFRLRLLEMIIENDLATTERYLAGEEIELSKLLYMLRALIAHGEILPMYCGSALAGIGIETLLDTIVALLPSPMNRDEQRPFGNEKGDYRHCSVQEPLSAIALKTSVDQFSGRLSVIRVVSGSLQSNQMVHVNGVQERCGAVFVLQGSELTKVDKLLAGEIGAVSRLEGCKTGDTLSDSTNPIQFPCPKFSLPAVSFAVEGESKVVEGLRKLAEEDPTLHIERDESTRETILSGMGQSHIEVALERLARKFGAKATIRERRVPYQQTIQRAIKVQGKLKKQSGGHGQFANCFLEILPNVRGAGLKFEDHVKGGVIPKQYIPAIEKGVIEAMRQGPLGNYPVVDIVVRVVDGTFHSVDSSDHAFSTAGSMAVKEALEKAGVTLLEPVMEVTVSVPDNHTGDVINDLSSRRAKIGGLETADGAQEVSAQVPMAELLDYGNALSAISGGRGTYTMERSHYDTVPAHLVEAALKLR